MRSPGLLWAAVGLVVLGLIGMAWLSVALPPPSARAPQSRRYSDDYDGFPRSGSPDSGIPLGQRIFEFGEGESGPVPRTALGPGMMGGGCADCHGRDGRGRTIRLMMGSFDTPDIRLQSLLEGEGGKPWTRNDVSKAIEQGVEPDGDRLDEFMPRWRLNKTEMSALVDYLEELSTP